MEPRTRCSSMSVCFPHTLAFHIVPHVSCQPSWCHLGAYRLRTSMPVYVDRVFGFECAEPKRSMYDATLFTRLHVSILNEACPTPSCVPRSIVHDAHLVGLRNVISKPTSMSRSRYNPVLWQVVGNAGYSMMFLVSLADVFSEPTA